MNRNLDESDDAYSAKPRPGIMFGAKRRGFFLCLLIMWVIIGCLSGPGITVSIGLFVWSLAFPNHQATPAYFLMQLLLGIIGMAGGAVVGVRKAWFAAHTVPSNGSEYGLDD
jgi:hypothetical protein